MSRRPSPKTRCASCVWRASRRAFIASAARRLSDRLRVSVACRELAEAVAAEHGNVHRSGEFGAAATLRLLERCDALRRPDRFAELLLACECDARGRLGLEEKPYAPRPRL